MSARGSFGYRPEYSKVQIESLENVELSSLADDEVLKWDASKEKWVNGSSGGGGVNVTTDGLTNTGRLVRVTGANKIDETGVSTDASDNITGVNDLDVGGNFTVTGTMGGITAAERTQLANIDTTTISATQWGYVGGLNQALATTDSPTFAALTVVGDMGGITAAERTQLANIDTTTISATQWGYVGGLNQALATTDSPTFAALTVVGDMGGITAAERTQLANINATTISTTQWGYVGAQDQGTATTDTPTFTGLSANSQRITDVGDPTSDGDAINRGFFNSRSMIYIYASSNDSFLGLTDVIMNSSEYSQGTISYDNTTGIATVEDGKVYLLTISLSLIQVTSSESGTCVVRLLRGDGTNPADFETIPGAEMTTTLGAGGFGNVISFSVIHYATGIKSGYRYLKLRSGFVGPAAGVNIRGNGSHWSIVEIA